MTFVNRNCREDEVGHFGAPAIPRNLEKRRIMFEVFYPAVAPHDPTQQGSCVQRSQHANDQLAISPIPVLIE